LNIEPTSAVVGDCACGCSISVYSGPVVGTGGVVVAGVVIVEPAVVVVEMIDVYTWKERNFL
jgi:hypothetical protein